MSDAFAIFITGLFGVFLGMALLYVAIQITSLVTNHFGNDGKKSA